jgi:hypothetical protein
MKKESITIEQIAHCIVTAAESFAPPGETPRTWQRATSATWLACTNQQRPRFACLMCQRPRWYGLKVYCEQCQRHVLASHRRIQRQMHRPCRKNLYSYK